MKNVHETYGPYIMHCPECNKLVDTVAAEGVPDQSLRGCPACGVVFWLTEEANAPARR
jgi:uncharacterized protein with PIN domain